MYIRMFYRTLLMVQAGFLSYLFLYGPRGLRDVERMQQTMALAQATLEEKKRVIMQLQEEESSWQHDSFNKERVAREKLQMARATDIVFYR
jgi:cell division protein FtsB